VDHAVSKTIVKQTIEAEAFASAFFLLIITESKSDNLYHTTFIYILSNATSD